MLTRSIIIYGVIAILLLSNLAACTHTEEEKLDFFTVGFATPEGNAIWVRKVRFDHRYTRPVGSLGCCWEQGGASSGVYNEPLPKHIYLEWIDESDKVLYTAEVELVADLEKRAKQMPEISSDDDRGITKGQIILAIGMGEHGEVVVWLTNFPYITENVRGRVLEEVGQTQALAMPWQRPVKL